MTTPNMPTPKRKQLRLPNFDYSQKGGYFITICTQNKEHLFCEIHGVEGRVIYGELQIEKFAPYYMIESFILKISREFEGIEVPEYVIMPNHVHFIVENCFSNTKLNDILCWFKKVTTNEYIRGVEAGIFKPFDKKVWQRNYYEHIIRDEKDYSEIGEYIHNNPLRWGLDRENV